jgi:hypothetical protein
MPERLPLSQSRLVAKVLRDELRAHRYETTTDLKDVLLRRLHQLRIRATTEAINAALDVVGSNTPLAHPPGMARRAPIERLDPAPPVFSREEAARVLDAIRQKVPCAPPLLRVWR